MELVKSNPEPGIRITKQIRIDLVLKNLQWEECRFNHRIFEHKFLKKLQIVFKKNGKVYFQVVGNPYLYVTDLDSVIEILEFIDERWKEIRESATQSRVSEFVSKPELFFGEVA